MASRRLLNLKTPSHNRVLIGVSFASGADTISGFAHIDSDGYAEDAYGMGDEGLLRIDEGNYELVLNDIYAELESCSITVETTSPKIAIGQPVFPALETITGSDQKKRSKFRFRIIGSAGDNLDLAYNDRIHIMLFLKNSVAAS